MDFLNRRDFLQGSAGVAASLASKFAAGRSRTGRPATSSRAAMPMNG